MTVKWSFWSTCGVGIVATILSASSVLGVEPEVDREIGLLLEKVAESGCDFERNGSVHSSTDAASHLALKYERGERYVDTAEDFIDRLATKSSWSGKPYWVICAVERTPSGDWLQGLLVEVRSAR
jgi:hypothetical protein